MRYAHYIPQFIMALVLLSSPPVLAQVAAAKIDDILAKSGLQREIEQQPDASVMLETIKNHIKSHMTSSELDSVLAWFDSDLGRKINKAEEDASSAEAYSQMRQFSAGLQSQPPDPLRKQLISELDRAARMSELMTGMKISMALNMAGVGESAWGHKVSYKDQMIAQINSRRALIQERSSRQVMERSLFTYRSISDNELKQYIDFFNSATGKKYTDTVTKALLTAVENSNQQAAREMRNSVKSGETSPEGT